MIRLCTALATAVAGFAIPLHAAPVELVRQSPMQIREVTPGVYLVDFGRVAFGNVRVAAPADAEETITVHFGEKLASGRIDRSPPGTVRYARTEVTLDGAKPIVVAPAADPRNTEQDSDRHPPAVLTPSEWGVVVPFRWVEIEGWPGRLRPTQISRRAAFAAAWDDDAASFRCSDEMLNRVWELCRYSIKATTFAGVYVDGDRERIPYEADAYLNQISHYACDSDVQMARDTFDRLMAHPTWPTEWAPHMIFMAHADWMHTGDREWLAARYDALKSKLLTDRVGGDGLVHSGPRHVEHDDIVDWPKGERDGYVFAPVNTVVNAFYLRSLHLMAEMAAGLGHGNDAAEYAQRARQARSVFLEKLFDREQGLFRDGEGVDHISLHANLFPLAFGLVPEDERHRVAEWLADRGMACSVYAAQYLLEGLFANGEGTAAVRLIVAEGDRSWRHMVESGTTITWEAWDLKYKPNQDWNHAWGAAPANLLPRYVLGVEPVVAGWRRARIRPCPGPLSHAKGKVPTPRGPVLVEWTRGAPFVLQVTLPEGMGARVELPAFETSSGVWSDGKPVSARRIGDRWVVDDEVTATSSFEVR